MATLDCKLRVTDHPRLLESTRDAVLAKYKQLPLGAQRKILKGPAFDGWLSVKLDSADVIVTGDWAVYIRARRLRDRYNAMIALSNALSAELATSIAIELLEDDDASGRLIELALSLLKWVLTVIASGVVGGAISYWLFGGT